MATQIPNPGNDSVSGTQATDINPAETTACRSVCLTEPGCSVCGDPADLRYKCHTGFCVLCSGCNERQVLFIHNCERIFVNPDPAEPVNQG